MSARLELLRGLEREELRAQWLALLAIGAAVAWALGTWSLLALSVAGVGVSLLGARRRLRGSSRTDLLLATAGIGVGLPLGLSGGEPAPGLAAFLLVAQAGKLAAPRGARDLGLAHVIGIVLLGVGAAEGVEPAFGLLLLVATALTYQVALRRSRTQLARETLAQGATVRAISARGAARPSAHGLVGGGRTILTLALTTLLIFFCFPRLGPKFLPARRQSRERLSGFTDQVGLEDIGRIKRSDQLAFRVELPPGLELDPAGPYWRGTALDTYDGSSWNRSQDLYLNWNLEALGGGLFQDKRLARPSSPPVEATVYLEPFGTRFLFAPGAVEELAFKTAGPRYVSRDVHGGMAIGQPASVPLAYRVRCWPDAITELRLPRSAQRLRERVCLQLPARVDRELLRRYADDVLQRARLATGSPASAVAHALESHLERSYAYSTEGTPPTEREPVEEFLFHRRKGHCEVFASALVVLLRIEGVPARLVTGFRGGDLNDWSGSWTVRQRDAHAWVEAWTERGWERFDATPADSAGASTPLVEAIRELGDWLELRWFQYVIAFDAYDQRNLLFWLQARVEDWLSRRGLPGVGPLRLLLALLIPGALGVGGLLLWRRRRRGTTAAGARADPAALRRLLAALRRHGLEPAPGETFLELARRAEEELGAPLAPLPGAVPPYYAARFGGRPGEAPAARLDALAAALETLPPSSS